MSIQNSEDFYREWQQAGFSTGMGNPEGIYDLFDGGKRLSIHTVKQLAEAAGEEKQAGNRR